MKKATLLLFVLLIAVLIVSCGAPAGTETAPGTTASSDAAATDSAASDTTTDTTASETLTLETSTLETSAPETSAPDTNYQNEKWDGETLKVLAIGNSFSDDSMEYLYKIAKAEGVKNIVLGNLYIGGCSIETHYNNSRNNSPAYEYRKNIRDAWQTRAGTTMLEGIQDEDWDIITMQQVSGYSGVPTFYRQLDGLVEYVKSNMTNPNCQFAWNMTWAYQGNSTHGDFGKYKNNQETMYQMIVHSVKRVVLSREEFSILLAPGTAIQNMRTSFVGDTLTRDGYHLSYDLGRYIAGYTWFRILTGKPLEDLKYSPINIIPNDTLKNAVLEAVNAAAVTPLDVTPSSYTEKPKA